MMNNLTNDSHWQAYLASASCSLLGIVFVVCAIMELILMWALMVTLLDMVADQAEKKLKNLKRCQNCENDGEYVKALSKFNKCLCLRDKVFRAGDVFLCCPFRIFGQSNIKRNPSTNLPLAGIGGICGDKVNKRLKLSGQCVQNKIVDFLVPGCIWPINKCRGFLGCYHAMPNVQRPGPRGRSIATWTRGPGSLQRMLGVICSTAYFSTHLDIP
jgi:hypothetical protein